MSDRQEIADAFNTVEGINVYPGFRESTKVGDGWMTLRLLEPTDFGFTQTWAVAIVIPQQEVAAEKWMDANLVSIVRAVRRQLDVSQIQPAEMQVQATGGSIRVIVVTGTRGI